MQIIHIAVKRIHIEWENLRGSHYVVLRLLVVVQVFKVMVKEVFQDLVRLVIRFGLPLTTGICIYLDKT